MRKEEMIAIIVAKLSQLTMFNLELVYEIVIRLH